MTLLKIALASAVLFVGADVALAQSADTNGPGKDTSGYAGGAQKAGASNQNAGGGSMKSMKKHKKKKSM